MMRAYLSAIALAVLFLAFPKPADARRLNASCQLPTTTEFTHNQISAFQRGCQDRLESMSAASGQRIEYYEGWAFADAILSLAD